MIKLTSNEIRDGKPRKKITNVTPAVREIIDTLDDSALEEISNHMSKEGIEGNRGHDVHAVTLILRKHDTRGILNGVPSAKIAPAFTRVLRERGVQVLRGIITGFLPRQDSDTQ